MSKKSKNDYIWRVTKDEGGEVNVSFGPKLSEANIHNDAKLHVLGKTLIQLGTQLMGSTVRDEDDEDEWEDD